MKPALNNKQNDLPFISVIIPTFNEARYIDSCLQSLIDLHYPKRAYEIIVVDNGSTDETVSICRRHTVSVYSCIGVTVAALRNYGASQAKGDVYAFIDGDCVADRDWLWNAAERLENEECLTGSKYDVPADATWIEKAWYSQKPKGRVNNIKYINAGNLILPATIFNKLGGFNEKLITGEDAELCGRAKKIVRLIADEHVRVTHLGNPKTLKAFVKRELWHGLGMIKSVHHWWLDLTFLGTLLFLLVTLMQVSGIIRLLIFRSADLLLVSMSVMTALMLATLLYRGKYISGITQGFQLFLLYYIYYAGRMVSLCYMILGKQYRRKK